MPWTGKKDWSMNWGHPDGFYRGLTPGRARVFLGDR